MTIYNIIYLLGKLYYTLLFVKVKKLPTGLAGGSSFRL